MKNSLFSLVQLSYVVTPFEVLTITISWRTFPMDLNIPIHAEQMLSGTFDFEFDLLQCFGLWHDAGCLQP